MKRIIVITVLLFCGGLAAKAQTTYPWLDSTRTSHIIPPLYIANGIIVNIAEVNPDFILSVDVFKSKESIEKWGTLGSNGSIYIKTDQQFDAITPRMYQNKGSLPSSVRKVVFMLNGAMVSDTIQISKAAVRKVDVLLGSDRVGLSADTACLSIWTWSEEESGLPKHTPDSKNGIRIRGARAGK